MTHDRSKGGANGHTRGGGGPVVIRGLYALRHWIASLGKWSRRTCRAQNHMADHVTVLAARMIGGVTPLGRKLHDDIGQENSTRLIDITAPIISGSRDQRQVEVASALEFIDVLRRDALARSKERRRKDFDDWVASALGGTAKEAYRWISLDSRAPQLSSS